MLKGFLTPATGARIREGFVAEVLSTRKSKRDRERVIWALGQPEQRLRGKLRAPVRVWEKPICPTSGEREATQGLEDRNGGVRGHQG